MLVGRIEEVLCHDAVGGTGRMKVILRHRDPQGNLHESELTASDVRFHQVQPSVHREGNVRVYRLSQSDVAAVLREGTLHIGPRALALNILKGTDEPGGGEGARG